MIDSRFSFESDDEYAHRLLFDKLDEGIPLTQDEQTLLNSLNLTIGSIHSDEGYEKLAEIEEKVSNGLELTPEEEEHLIKMILSDGDSNLGATT